MIRDVAQLRKDYGIAGLQPGDLAAEPMVQFDTWVKAAIEADVPEPNAMTLATTDADGEPDARIVLLKGYDHEAVCFYTNYASAKGKQLAANPRAALVLFWPDLERQIRLRGPVEKMARADSEAYFHSRPRGSQIGAVVSPQSEVIPDRETLEARVAEVEAQHAGDEPIPLPESWGGYRLIPHTFEFWQGRSSRLHDRLRYRRGDGGGWVVERLSP